MRIYKIAHKYSNPISWPKEIWNLIYKRMKSVGFNFHGPDDTKNLFFKLLKKSPNFLEDKDIFKEWHDAIDRAFDSRKERQSNLKEKETERSKFQNVNWQRLKELGKTVDFKEAGYIANDGTLINLSSRNSGFSERDLDHREAGGTRGMQELMMYGYIRIDFKSGNIEIRKEPTPEQYKTLSRFIYSCSSDYFYIDLGNGFNTREIKNGYYLNNESMDFLQIENSGEKKRSIIQQIMNYWRKQKENYVGHI